MVKEIENKEYIHQSIAVKIYLSLFVMLPIINQYRFGALTFIQLYTVAGFVIWFVYDKNKSIKSKILVYFLYVFAISVIGLLFIGNGDISQLVLRLSSFGFLIINFYIVFPKLCDADYVIRVYSFIVILVTFIFFIQYFIFIIFGKPLMLLIPGTTLNYSATNSNELMNYTLDRINTGYYYRPCSIFIEPGYQAMYCIPFVGIKLFSNDQINRFDIFQALLVSVSMILTTSSMAIFSCFIIWVVFIIRLFTHTNTRMLRSFLFTIPLLFIGLYFVLHSSGVLISIQIKTRSVQNISESSSFTWRVLRGFECFKGIGFFQQLFGCGYGDVSNYLHSINLKTIYDTNLTMIDYMSGFFYMLCSIGIIGAVILTSLIFPYINKAKKNPKVRILTICLLIIMLTAAVFDTDKFFLYLGLIICISIKEQANANDGTELQVTKNV